MDVKETVKVGTLILMTRGSYDDYGPEGLYRALETFDIADYRLKYRDRRSYSPTYRLDYDFDQIIADGKLVQVNYEELWVGG